MEVVKTSSAGHAKKLASSVDFSTCPDGIVIGLLYFNAYDIHFAYAFSRSLSSFRNYMHWR